MQTNVSPRINNTQKMKFSTSLANLFSSIPPVLFIGDWNALPDYLVTEHDAQQIKKVKICFIETATVIVRCAFLSVGNTVVFPTLEVGIPSLSSQSSVSI